MTLPPWQFPPPSLIPPVSYGIKLSFRFQAFEDAEHEFQVSVERVFCFGNAVNGRVKAAAWESLTQRRWRWRFR